MQRGNWFAAGERRDEELEVLREHMHPANPKEFRKTGAELAFGDLPGAEWLGRGRVKTAVRLLRSRNCIVCERQWRVTEEF